LEAYYNEEYKRYQTGEFEYADSMKIADSLKFKTSAGKIVYGGGGITPDVFVPLDTTGHSHYLNEVSYKGLINDFAFSYADKERKKLKEYKTVQNFNASFIITPAAFNEFIAYAKKNKVVGNAKQIDTSEELIRTTLKALIARNIWNNEGYYPVIQSRDNVLKKAIELMK
jgi:carboxyl-terminal processing protease